MAEFLQNKAGFLEISKGTFHMQSPSVLWGFIASCRKMLSIASQLWSLSFVLHWYFLWKDTVSDVSKCYNTCRDIFLSQLKKTITFYQSWNVFRMSRWKSFWSSVSLVIGNISSRYESFLLYFFIRHCVSILWTFFCQKILC